MLKKDLFEKVLLNPAISGCDELDIVSGYASASMVTRHMEALKEIKLANKIKINLVIGMSPKDGIFEDDLTGFRTQKLETYPGNFDCSFITTSPSIHSKLYLWKKEGIPRTSFLGSANYTQNGFFPFGNGELMDACDPTSAKEYFEDLNDKTTYCNSPLLQENITIKSKKQAFEDNNSTIFSDSNSITLSLISKQTGDIQQKGGLNWGQRDGRDHNQAYLHIPAKICKSNFFPNPRTIFTMITDDNKSLLCTRAQSNGKAIETPAKNSLLGEYFRNRLGVESGAPVTLAHLQNYGRTNIEITKIDDSTYYLNFDPTLQ